MTGRENLPDTADAVRGQAAERPTVAHLLGAWRAAERRWEAMSPDDPALPERLTRDPVPPDPAVRAEMRDAAVAALGSIRERLLAG